MEDKMEGKGKGKGKREREREREGKREDFAAGDGTSTANVSWLKGLLLLLALSFSCN